jgi:hypothetical protein
VKVPDGYSLVSIHPSITISTSTGTNVMSAAAIDDLQRYIDAGAPRSEQEA